MLNTRLCISVESIDFVDISQETRVKYGTECMAEDSEVWAPRCVGCAVRA